MDIIASEVMNMEIVRYLNGEMISKEKLHSYSILTPEVTDVVKEVRQRVMAADGEKETERAEG